MMDNDGYGLGAGAVSKARLDSQIITQTLDTLNSCSSSSSSYDGTGSNCGSSSSDSMSSSYEFNKDVLSAAYSPKGALVNNGV